MYKGEFTPEMVMDTLVTVEPSDGNPSRHVLKLWTVEGSHTKLMVSSKEAVQEMQLKVTNWLLNIVADIKE